MDTDNIVTKEKAEYRIRKIEVQGKEVIDSIIITYDDKSVWSYGLGGGKSHGKTVTFAKNECLVRVTHETLVNQRWAGASLELETNRGRVFTFEPVCSTTAKHNRTTITADPGMELVSMKIKFGALVGFTQQPRPVEEVVAAEEWYSILYQETKEGEETGAEITEFSEQGEAENWWREISEKCRMKAGRGALYIDTRRNRILKNVGTEQMISDLVTQAEEKGLYLDMKEQLSKLSIFAVFSAVSKALLTREYTVQMIYIIALIMSHKILTLEMMNLTGQLISVLSDNSTPYNTSFYGNTLCKTVLKCDSRFEYTRSMLIALLVLLILERVVYLAQTYLHCQGYHGITGNLRTKSLEKALSLHQGYHDSHTASEVNCMSNVDNVSRLITWNFPWTFSYVLGAFANGFYLVNANPVVGSGIVAFLAILNIFYLIPLEGKSMKLRLARWKLEEGAEDLANEAVTMISTVKQFSQERIHIEKQRVAEKGWVECETGLVLIRIRREFFEDSVKYLLLAVMIAYEMVSPHQVFGPAEFLTFYMLFSMFHDDFWWLNYYLKLLEEDLSAVERYVDFMSTPAEVISGNETASSLEEDIKLENVHFGYPTRVGEKVFSGLDLKIRHKKMTAIVGDSGSGKTTLAKLIMRLYDPQQGRITIGGTDIRNFDLTSLHGKMSIVSQNPGLLNTTLEENIAYGAVSRDKITMTRIRKAAELANCDFINKFRSGLDTFAGSQGLQLSGGQKQRIAIARAAMRDPEILILDEATSALDAQNEKEVQEALDKLMQGKTTIVIAHRLSTVRHADEIICLKEGEVKERGTHEELMKLGKYYATLVSKQIVEDTGNNAGGIENSLGASLGS